MGIIEPGDGDTGLGTVAWCLLSSIGHGFGWLGPLFVAFFKVMKMGNHYQCDGARYQDKLRRSTEEEG
jgi:hypothetical protein